VERCPGSSGSARRPDDLIQRLSQCWIARRPRQSFVFLCCSSNESRFGFLRECVVPICMQGVLVVAGH
jgi:hypothetical protein